MKTMKKIKVLLASPRGFCAGVKRAIDMVDLALQNSNSPIYVRHEIVHNKRVVNDLKRKGAIFWPLFSQIYVKFCPICQIPRKNQRKLHH